MVIGKGRFIRYASESGGVKFLLLSAAGSRPLLRPSSSDRICAKV